MDKDSGTRRVPPPLCPVCHHKVFFTAGGRMLHINPRSVCRG